MVATEPPISACGAGGLAIRVVVDFGINEMEELLGTTNVRVEVDSSCLEYKV
jgi:hypothetical protein